MEPRSELGVGCAKWKCPQRRARGAPWATWTTRTPLWRIRDPLVIGPVRSGLGQCSKGLRCLPDVPSGGVGGRSAYGSVRSGPIGWSSVGRCGAAMRTGRCSAHPAGWASRASCCSNLVGTRCSSPRSCNSTIPWPASCGAGSPPAIAASCSNSSGGLLQQTRATRERRECRQASRPNYYRRPPVVVAVRHRS